MEMLGHKQDEERKNFREQLDDMQKKLDRVRKQLEENQKPSWFQMLLPELRIECPINLSLNLKWSWEKITFSV